MRTSIAPLPSVATPTRDITRSIKSCKHRHERTHEQTCIHDTYTWMFCINLVQMVQLWNTPAKVGPVYELRRLENRWCSTRSRGDNCAIDDPWPPHTEWSVCSPRGHTRRHTGQVCDAATDTTLFYSSYATLCTLNGLHGMQPASHVFDPIDMASV